MRKPLVRAALITAAVTAALLPPSAASAATFSNGDMVGDVVETTYDPDTGEETVHPAGSETNVDLNRVVLRHTATRVVLIASYETLVRSTNRFFVFAEVRTHEGVRRDLGIDTSGRWAGTAFIMRSARDVRCPGLRHEIDYAADTAMVSVPRSCLSRPRWVQARVGAFGIPEGGDGNQMFYDAGRNGSTDTPRWTARVARG